MRIPGFAAKWLFVLCLPLLLLAASLGGVANNLSVYKHGFTKYNISQTTGIAEAELEKAAKGLISYFNSDEEFINITVVKDGKPFVLFNQREIIHLKDVKGLIQLDYRLLAVTLIYVLGYAVVSLIWRRKRYWRRLAWGLVGGGSLTLALMMALGLGVLLGFDQLFLQFHFISFTNELWWLNPATDYLIMLFPQGFFYDAALLCTIATALGALVLGGLGASYLVRSRKGS